MVQFDPQADLWLDVEAFEIQASHDDVASLQSAVALYRGDFLDGFYDAWIINERYRLETLFSEVLARLMITHEARGEPMPRWSQRCACSATIPCVRTRIGWRCAPIAGWGSATRRWSNTAVAGRSCGRS